MKCPMLPFILSLLLFVSPLVSSSDTVYLTLDQWNRIQTLLNLSGQNLQAFEKPLETLKTSTETAYNLTLDSSLITDDLNENLGKFGEHTDLLKTSTKSLNNTIENSVRSHRQSTLRTILILMGISLAAGSVGYFMGDMSD